MKESKLLHPRERSGNIGGIRYFVERYSPEATTIAIEADIPSANKAIHDMRFSKQFNHTNAALQKQISELMKLGVDYIDIGTLSDWVACEVPITIEISSDKMQMIVKGLDAIRVERISKQKAPVNPKKLPKTHGP